MFEISLNNIRVKNSLIGYLNKNKYIILFRNIITLFCELLVDLKLLIPIFY